MSQHLEEKLLATVRRLASNRTAYVCYSGGVDSTLVLAACVRAGLKTVALLGISPSLSAAERADAVWLAYSARAGVRLIRSSRDE